MQIPAELCQVTSLRQFFRFLQIIIWQYRLTTCRLTTILAKHLVKEQVVLAPSSDQTTVSSIRKLNIDYSYLPHNIAFHSAPHKLAVPRGLYDRIPLASVNRSTLLLGYPLTRSLLKAVAVTTTQRYGTSVTNLWFTARRWVVRSKRSLKNKTNL